MAGLTATLLNTDGPEYQGVQKVERYSISNGAPTVAAGSGSGTGGTATINSAASDMSGQLVITTGTAIPGGGGTLAAVTFANTMAGTPTPHISAAGANGAALFAGTSAPWCIATTAGFSVMAGSATASTAYTLNYSVPDARVSFALTARWVQNSPQAIGEGIDITAQSFSNGTATLSIRPNFTDGRLRLITDRD